MSLFSRISLAYKALYELGFRSLTLNALYRLGLATGHYKRTLNAELGTIKGQTADYKIAPLLALPSPEAVIQVVGEAGKAVTLAQANEIAQARVRLFGAEPVDLKLAVDDPLVDWTSYERGRADLRPLTSDVKFLWEPARLGWAFTLGRAYWLSKEPKYAEAFWQYFETFTQANPPYLGPQWMSAQEAALRSFLVVFASQIFADAPASSPERQNQLARSLAEHAARIPPTLVYARSQRNNHLLIEAAGLFAAGLALPNQPQASQWRQLGWKWLNRGLQGQIDGYGEYSQHSTNYHRLMLQVVLWVNALLRGSDVARAYRWPRPTVEAITRSVHWLLALLDADSGRVPNLGANDGAYILPLTICPYEDFRPVLTAAARAFLDYDLPAGRWDEMSLWFGVPLQDKRYVQLSRYLGDHLYGQDSWAYLRTAQFDSRPSHADQLHLDLWWRGLNIAQDAGSYRYTAEPPWDNSFTTARVHNTVTVDGCDQMTRAGRFLYVDWVNAYRVEGSGSAPAIIQRARGRYRNVHQNYRHSRQVTVLTGDRWRVEDELMPLRWTIRGFSHSPRLYRLHWLLPDWEWQMEKCEAAFDLRLKSPHGWVTLSIAGGGPSPFQPESISLVRAGETLYACGSVAPEPVRGWTSPTYGVKVPALSLAVEMRSSDDVQFTSEFIFP